MLTPPKGLPVSIYSILNNGTYMLPSFIVSAIIMIIVISAVPKRIFLQKSLYGTVKKEKRVLNWYPCQGHMKKRVKQLKDDSYTE